MAAAFRSDWIIAVAFGKETDEDVNSEEEAEAGWYCPEYKGTRAFVRTGR